MSRKNLVVTWNSIYNNQYPSSTINHPNTFEAVLMRIHNLPKRPGTHKKLNQLTITMSTIRVAPFTSTVCASLIIYAQARFFHGTTSPIHQNFPVRLDLSINVPSRSKAGPFMSANSLIDVNDRVQALALLVPVFLANGAE
jgi:hypothetical protein